MRSAVLGLLAASCVADDVDVKESGDTGDEPADPAAAIEGAWVSEGDDLAPLFTLFYYTRIDADFAADGSYTVTALDTNGATYDFTGTYAVATETEPHTITLQQATPAVATAQGIWSVDASGVLTYEVVQVTPDVGFVPPTPEAGFGSTTGAGLAAGDNVQVFRRP